MIMNKIRIITINALYIFLAITGFFFLMKVLGLDNVSELRLLNFLFVFWGINRAIRMNIKENKQVGYFRNFLLGAVTSVLAVGFTILGLILYVTFIESAFIGVLENSSFWGKNLSLPLVVFAFAIEGVASSVICAFILMQYYKNYKLVNPVSV